MDILTVPLCQLQWTSQCEVSPKVNVVYMCNNLEVFKKTRYINFCILFSSTPSNIGSHWRLHFQSGFHSYTALHRISSSVLQLLISTNHTHCGATQGDYNSHDTLNSIVWFCNSSHQCVHYTQCGCVQYWPVSVQSYCENHSE